MERAPERGDIIWITMSPTFGHDRSGRRPALVLSPATYNSKSGLALLCPITSRIKGYPFEVPLPEGLPVSGAVLADQVRSIDWQARPTEYACQMPAEDVDRVLRALGRLLAP